MALSEEGRLKLASNLGEPKWSKAGKQFISKELEEIAEDDDDDDEVVDCFKLETLIVGKIWLSVPLELF